MGESSQIEAPQGVLRVVSRMSWSCAALYFRGLDTLKPQCDDVATVDGAIAGGKRMTDKLTAGDTFPNLELSIAGAGTISLPDAIETPFAIVLFYRGHW